MKIKINIKSFTAQKVNEKNNVDNNITLPIIYTDNCKPLIPNDYKFISKKIVKTEKNFSDKCKHGFDIIELPSSDLSKSFDIDALFGCLSFNNLKAFKTPIFIELNNYKKIRNNTEVVFSNGIFKKVKKLPHFYIGKCLTSVGAFSIFYCYNKEKTYFLNNIIENLKAYINSASNTNVLYKHISNYINLNNNENLSTLYFTLPLELITDFLNNAIKQNRRDFLFIESYGNKAYTMSTTIKGAIDNINIPFDLKHFPHLIVDVCMSIVPSSNHFIVPNEDFFNNIAFKPNYNLFNNNILKNLNIKFLKIENNQLLLFNSNIRKFNFYSLFEDSLAGIKKTYKPTMSIEDMTNNFLSIGLISKKK